MLAFSLPLGNPWEASLFCDGVGVFTQDCCPFPVLGTDWISGRIGFYGDYVFNRNLAARGTLDHGDIRTVEMNTTAASLTMNFCNRTDLFVTLGATNFDLVTPQKSFSPFSDADALVNNGLFELDTNTYFSWSIGGRATVWSCDCFALGFEGQYFFTAPSVNSVFNASSGSNVMHYPADIQFKYQEWQLGLGATYQVCLSESIQVLPYLGVTWSHSWADLGNGVDTLIGDDGATNLQYHYNTLREQRPWGYAVGLTLRGCDRYLIGVEGRFYNETALFVNSSIQF